MSPKSFAWLVLCLLPACAAPSLDATQETLLRLEDERVTDARTWEPWLLLADSPEVRRRAARAVGHLRDPSMATLLLRALEVEVDASVHPELLFALGQTASPLAIDPLLKHLVEGDADTRARAAEALGKVGSPSTVPVLIESLADPSAAVRGHALLALTRLRGRRAGAQTLLDEGTERTLLERLEALLNDPDERIRWQACYALSEIPLAGREAALVGAMSAEGNWTRLFAVRGLGRLESVGEAALRGLVKAVEDPDVHMASSAIEVLVQHGTVGAMPELHVAVARRGKVEDFHVRAAGYRAASALMDAEADVSELLPALEVALDGDPSRTVRNEALHLWVRILQEESLGRLAEAAASGDVFTRIAAARAMGALHRPDLREPLWQQLGGDEDARVVVQALESLGGAEGVSTEVVLAAAREACQSPDLAIRGTGLTLLGAHGSAADLDAVRAAHQRGMGFESVEVRVSAVQTAGAWESPEVVVFLQEALADSSHAVRLAAKTALEAKGVEVPPLSKPVARPSNVLLQDQRDVTGPQPRVALVTDQGTVVLVLLRDEAPRHVRSFLRLADKGAYDGLLFHRVVTGFVVQGLDPRGDGWGSGGVFLRDEINPEPYGAGALGMPNAGPDTAGCQIFVTHVPTPHLDGRYTVFGQVVEGMDVLDALEVGDVCRRVEILSD